MISCSNEGIISIWPDGQEQKVILLMSFILNNIIFQSEINVGAAVDVMAASSEADLMIATGGKSNDLKLWDGNRPDAPPVFKARNVRFKHHYNY